MVVHQSEGMDRDIMLAAGHAQQASEVVAVIVIDEDRSAIHSALGHVQGEARKLKAWCPRQWCDGSGASAQRAVAMGVFAIGKRRVTSDAFVDPFCSLGSDRSLLHLP